MRKLRWRQPSNARATDSGGKIYMGTERPSLRTCKGTSWGDQGRPTS